MSRDQALQLLAMWRSRGWIRPLDLAFAHFIGDLDPSCGGRLLLASALASQQLGRGHICLSLTMLLDDPNAMLTGVDDDDLGVDDADSPPAIGLAGQGVAQWLAELRPSPVVGDGPGNTPLVLVADRLYLRRYWRHEIDVAAGIRTRLSLATEVPDDLAARLNQLFDDGPNPERPNWQKIACALAVRKGFCVITGGPGTGKTTTVVRLLALLQSNALQRGRALRIRLAAPTGKAAARLTESIAKSIALLPPEMQADIPLEAATLHKLLGARPGTRHLRHNADNPLHADVVIVDEASMIDLEMMAALLNALPVSTRLVLLGDKDQLASVEAGSVLGDLCRNAGAEGYDAETVDWLRRVTGRDLPIAAESQSPLDRQIAMLRVSHRFDEHSGIGQLAWAVNSGEPQRADAVWRRQPPFTDIRRIALRHRADRQFEQLAIDGWDCDDAVGYRHYLQQLRQTRPAAGADGQAHTDWALRVLAAFDRFQLLCALRSGPWGVETLNRRVAERLRELGLIARTQGWYEGRPVLVTRNDYGLGLMNGDVGIALKLPDADSGESRLRVVFRQSEQCVKQVLPSRLHDVETVFAMTVHKSQGSEFEHVALVLPDRAGAVLTRELVYTGITRAKRRFTLLAGDDAAWLEAITRRVKRAGGLAELLADSEQH